MFNTLEQFHDHSLKGIHGADEPWILKSSDKTVHISGSQGGQSKQLSQDELLHQQLAQWDQLQKLAQAQELETLSEGKQIGDILLEAEDPNKVNFSLLCQRLNV